MLAVSASDEPNDGRKTAGEHRRTDLRGSVRGKRNGGTRWKATTSPRNVLLRCVVTVRTNAVAILPVSKLRPTRVRDAAFDKTNEYAKIAREPSCFSLVPLAVSIAKPCEFRETTSDARKMDLERKK